MPPVDRILVLGDTVGYGPDPNAVIDRLRSVRAFPIQQQRDDSDGGRGLEIVKPIIREDTVLGLYSELMWDFLPVP